MLLLSYRLGAYDVQLFCYSYMDFSYATGIHTSVEYRTAGGILIIALIALRSVPVTLEFIIIFSLSPGAAAMPILVTMRPWLSFVLTIKQVYQCC